MNRNRIRASTVDDYFRSIENTPSPYPTILLPQSCQDEIKKFVGIKGDMGDHAKQERNQSDEDSNAEQEWWGKAFEWIAYYTLVGQNLAITPPDMKIYKKEDKNWDRDMGELFQCKGYCFSRTHSLSWVLQKSNANGKGGRDKKSYQNETVLVLGVVSQDKTIGKITNIITMSDVWKYELLEDPKSLRLRGIKDCIYLDAIFDLKVEGKDIEQFQYLIRDQTFSNSQYVSKIATLDEYNKALKNYFESDSYKTLCRYRDTMKSFEKK